jgi:hypothetical protein
MAMAAKRPMMATTIMISTSVKPALRRFFVCFILFAFVFYRGGTMRQAGLDNDCFVRFIACRNHINPV